MSIKITESFIDDKGNWIVKFNAADLKKELD